VTAITSREESAGQPPVLYFIHASGCHGCDLARPAVGRFFREAQGRVRVVPVDLTRAEWRATAWEPEMTPTLVVRYPDGRLSERLEGWGGEEEFRAWLAKVLR
jgi:thioredoxin-like negative regulator of GroEL